MLSEDIIEVSTDNFLPIKSPSECRPGLANTEIKYKVMDYILEEIVPSECDLEAFSNEESNVQYFDYSPLSEDESNLSQLNETFLSQSEGSHLSEQKSSENEKKRTFKKKRNRNVELWKCNVKKRLREAGKPYVSTSNKMVPAKKLQPPCNDCSFKCTEVFTAENRMNIFQSFWNMNDHEKKNFYLKFVTRNPIKRRRTQSNIRQFSFHYFFEKNESLCRVCQTFFLNTLCISRKRIYKCFEMFKHKVADSPPPRKNKKRVTRSKSEKEVSVESRYKSTNREIKCTDFEYILVEHVPDEIAVLSDLEFPTDAKENSNNEHLDYLALTEDEAVVPHSKVINFSEDEFIIPHSDIRPAIEKKSIPLEKTKVKKNTEVLKYNLRKRLGKPYGSKTKKTVLTKTLKPPCNNDCIFKCIIVFTDEDRMNILQSFWDMTDDEKTSFYSKCIIRCPVQRQISKSEAITKQFSFKYYFEKNDTMYRVCRTFFLNTLCITLRSVYNYFANLENNVSPSTLPRKKGQNAKQVTRSNSPKKVSANRFLPKKSAELANSETEDNDYEYILEEIVSTEEASVCDSEFSTYSTEESIKDSLYYPTSSEQESSTEEQISSKQKSSPTGKFGKTYKSTSKKMVVTAKTMKPPCNDCIFKCMNVFTDKDRLNICQSFSNMTDHERNKFYSKYVMRYPVQLRKSKSDAITKQFMFKYFLDKNDSTYRVCSTFFLNTLSITSKIIDIYFENLKNKVSVSTVPRKKGKNAKRSTAPNKLSKARERVSSIPTVDSPYRRSNSEINVSANKCLPMKSPSECRFELANSVIEDKDIEYILEEIVSAEEASVCDSEFPAYSKEESIKHYLDYPILSEDEAIVPPSKVKTCHEEKSSSVQKTKPSESALDKKRKRDTESWKCNINKRLRESGQPYMSTSKKMVPAKTLKPPCKDCVFSCTKVFTTEDRMNIFQLFWKMTDDEKTSFYLKFVIRGPVLRRRTKSEANVKQFSFNYFFEKNESMYRVCRTFFTNTLAIDRKRIYYCFANLQDSGSPLPRKKGKNTKRVTAPNKLSEVREHITSINTVEAGLNIRKMYNLYLENYEDPVGLHIYRRVLKDEFNISFPRSQKRRL